MGPSRRGVDREECKISKKKSVREQELTWGEVTKEGGMVQYVYNGKEKSSA